MNMRKGWSVALGLVLLLASQATFAGSARAVRKQAEASMLVTGRIQVDAEGRVTTHSLDQPDKLPAGVVTLIGKAVPTWVFKPTLVDGRPVRVATGMRIRVVARKLDADNFEISLRSATFGAPAGDSMAKKSSHMPPPDYPIAAARGGVAGTVYLLVRVDRDGKVSDAIAEQTNLKIVQDDNTMARWRKVFEDASLRQARKWTFGPSTLDPTANDVRVMRVPVMFSLEDSRRKTATYGGWEAYVPGPRQRNPWNGDDQEGIGFSPDTLAPGRAYLAGSGLKLLSSLSGT